MPSGLQTAFLPAPLEAAPLPHPGACATRAAGSAGTGRHVSEMLAAVSVLETMFESLILACSQPLSEPGGPGACQTALWHGPARTDRMWDASAPLLVDPTMRTADSPGAQVAAGLYRRPRSAGPVIVANGAPAQCTDPPGTRGVRTPGDRSGMRLGNCALFGSPSAADGTGTGQAAPISWQSPV
jgi:hypothetical protein